MNINEWEKTPRPTRYRRLKSRIQIPATTRRHQQHLTKTQCLSRHRWQQLHHEEDPELFVDTDIQRLAKWTWHDVLRVADVLRVTGGIRMTQCAGCLIPGQMAL